MSQVRHTTRSWQSRVFVYACVMLAALAGRFLDYGGPSALLGIAGIAFTSVSLTLWFDQ